MQVKNYEEEEDSQWFSEQEEEEAAEEEPNSDDESFIDRRGEEEEEEEEEEFQEVPVNKRQRRPHQAKLPSKQPGVSEKPSSQAGPKRVAANRKPAARKPPAAAKPQPTAAAGSTRKRKAEAEPEVVEELPEPSPGKKQPPTVTMDERALVRDFSRPDKKFIRDKFILDADHTIQIGDVNFNGTRAFCYEALIFKRYPKKSPEDPEGAERKAFQFNMNARKTIKPLRDALTSILVLSGFEEAAA